MFIEFNGIPGSGKSTICKELIQKLNVAGSDVVFLQEKVVHLSKHKVLMPLMILWEVFHGAGPIVCAYYNLYISLPLRNSEAKVMAFASLKNAILAYRVSRRNKSSYIVSDQCIVQNIASCFYNQSIKDRKTIENILMVIDNKIEKFILVNIDIDMHVAKSRIAERNTTGGRLDFLKDDQLNEALIKQSDLLKEIRSLYKGETVNIDSLTSPLSNAQLIIDSIEGGTTV